MVTGGTAEPADADLVERALAGKRDAFETIYCRYQRIVYRFARSMTGSASMAEDVTQEVFVALMRDLGRYQPQRASLSTYLYGSPATSPSASYAFGCQHRARASWHPVRRSE
jgi:RNA polymerase sigma-70 factor, ECF subfamily